MKANAAPRRRLASDDAGALPVVEAILAAIIILAAILYFTQARRPASGAETAGVDLRQTAADNLQILRTKTFTVCDGTGVAASCVDTCPASSPAPPVGALNLTAWVTSAVDGNCHTVQEVGVYLDDVIAATGARYVLRIGNGLDKTSLVPWNTTLVPHSGRAAGTMLFPTWSTYRFNTTVATASPGAVVSLTNPSGPGQLLYNMTASSAIRCIRAPDGSDRGPGYVKWNTTWHTTAGKVPTTVPYGIWGVSTSATNPSCLTTLPGMKYVRIQPTASTYVLMTGSPTPTPVATSAVPSADFPTYTLELVVWFGA